MALKKNVTLQNGIIVTYHKISMMQIDVNQRITLLVHSYLAEEGRQVEKDYANGKYNNIDMELINWPYQHADYINIPYDETMTIEKAYEYLKTLPEFEGAEDV